MLYLMHFMVEMRGWVAQSYFEYLKIPYTHSRVISSYNAMNKLYQKIFF